MATVVSRPSRAGGSLYPRWGAGNKEGKTAAFPHPGLGQLIVIYEPLLLLAGASGDHCAGEQPVRAIPCDRSSTINWARQGAIAPLGQSAARSVPEMNEGEDDFPNQVHCVAGYCYYGQFLLLLLLPGHTGAYTVPYNKKKLINKGLGFC
jgi:hypothetical protein